MTISSESNRNSYTGNGTSNEYDFTYQIISESNLSILVKNPTTGEETDLAINTDYTVGESSITLVDNGQAWIDGSGFLDDGWIIVLLRVVSLTQNTDIRNQGSFYPEVHEDQFDKSTMIDQQQQDEIDRAVRLSPGTDPNDFSAELPSEIVGEANVVVMTSATGDSFIKGPTASEISGASQEATDAAASAAAAAASADEAESAVKSAWRDVLYIDDTDSPILAVNIENGDLYASDATNGNIVINLPELASLDLVNPWQCGVKKTDASSNTITINAFAGDLIGGVASVVISRANAGMTLIPDDDWTSLSFGEVPISGAIVGTTDAQTLTNKTIETVAKLEPKHDTLANLETYAATATNGQIVYATDEKKSYEIIDSELSLMGGGAGVGDTSVYKMLDADTVGVTDWTTSLTGATFVEKTVDPLAGEKSYLYSTDTNINDDVYIDIPVPIRSRQSETHKINFPYIQTGTEGSITLSLYDVTNTTTIKTIELNNDDNRYSLIFSMASDCEVIRMIITSATDGVATLEIDQIVLSDKAYEYGSVTESESIVYKEFVSRDGSNIVKLKTKVSDTSNDYLEDNMTASSILTFKKRTPFSCTASSAFASSGAIYLQLCNSSGSVLLNPTENSVLRGSLSLIGIAEVGDYLRLLATQDPDDTADCHLSVTATCQSQTVQFEDDTGNKAVEARIYATADQSFGASTETVVEFDTVNYDTHDAADLAQNGIIVPESGYYDMEAGIMFNFGVTDPDYALELSIHSDATKVSPTEYVQARRQYWSNNVVANRYLEKGALITAKAKHYSSGSSSTISWDDTRVFLSISKNMPDTLPRMLVVNSSQENDFDVDASDAGVLSNFNGASDWCTFDSLSGAEFSYDLNTDSYTEFPIIVPTCPANIEYNAIVYYDTFPRFRVRTRNLHSTSNTPVAHQISAKKRGADRSSRSTPVVHGKDVSKEQVMYVDVNATNATNSVVSTTSYKTRSLEGLRGDIFGSITSDVLTVPRGEYAFTLVGGGYNADATSIIGIYDGSSYLFERGSIYVASGNRAVTTINVRLSFTESKTLEFRTKSSSTSGNEYIGDITVRKLS